MRFEDGCKYLLQPYAGTVATLEHGVRLGNSHVEGSVSSRGQALLIQLNHGDQGELGGSGTEHTNQDGPYSVQCRPSKSNFY